MRMKPLTKLILVLLAVGTIWYGWSIFAPKRVVMQPISTFAYEDIGERDFNDIGYHRDIDAMMVKENN